MKSEDQRSSPTEDYLISNNIIYIGEDQVAAIRVNADKVKGIVIKNNLLRGKNRGILVGGKHEKKVVVDGNEGALTQEKH